MCASPIGLVLSEWDPHSNALTVGTSLRLRITHLPVGIDRESFVQSRFDRSLGPLQAPPRTSKSSALAERSRRIQMQPISSAPPQNGPRIWLTRTTFVRRLARRLANPARRVRRIPIPGVDRRPTMTWQLGKGRSRRRHLAPPGVIAGPIRRERNTAGARHKVIAHRAGRAVAVAIDTAHRVLSDLKPHEKNRAPRSFLRMTPWHAPALGYC